MADEHAAFDAHVLTPEGEVYSGDVVQISTRTEVGEIGILARHAPLVARLWPALLRLHLPDGEVRRYAQGEGWLEVFANRARVLIAEAIPPEDLDVAELRERLADAERRLEETASEEPESTPLPGRTRQRGSAANLQAWRDHRRAERFIQIAEGGD
jgi:F-type H+-transporting ATPase subunit epsilon